MQEYLNTLIIMKGAVLARIHTSGIVSLLDEDKRVMSQWKHLGMGTFQRIDKTEKLSQVW